MKAAERRLHDDNDRLTSEVARLKKEIEDKVTEKYRAIEEAKADGDQRVSFRKLSEFSVSLSWSLTSWAKSLGFCERKPLYLANIFKSLPDRTRHQCTPRVLLAGIAVGLNDKLSFYSLFDGIELCPNEHAT